MDLTSSSHLTWERFLNRFFVPSQPHSGLLKPKVEFHVPVLSRGYILEKTLLNKSATVMPMRKSGSLGRKTVKSKAVEHTRAAEAPDEKRARLQADQVRHSLARAAETPEQYQVRLSVTSTTSNTLLILEDKILSITGNKLALYGLPEPVHDHPELRSKDVLRETSYAVQALRAYMAANVPRLTPDQQQVFIAITEMIGSESGGIGDLSDSTGLIIMPCGQIANSPGELLSKVYLNIQQNFKDQEWLSHRAIPASRNDVFEKLNVTI
ncbi:hypothetical protein TNIN_101301 [Trichonephila inaurata madagascariensis]|uniref:Uncharacterized protein n=1 Tax=Trichonephila inaurata madagascariensis TaxID=2747483 RepID=A0A8X7CP23_9ARAC|nr:hypothetical protein TNIN_101301 [Trichonephila inaurata madagascariensis]